ncbi:MAG: FumA C-terminus/TtdB family hydratase beta subunit [Lachnospiraceae bacterium]|jgi:fumarate hydratase subunit beta
MKEIKINAPFFEEITTKLRAGDMVYITGTVYSARDAAHKRLYEAVLAEEELPFPLRNGTIYYLGPTLAREGRVIGSAGPTTSSRMDKYTPALLQKGLKAMIGKGRRSENVKSSIIENKAVYLAATGGAGALLSGCIKNSKTIAYADLGTEAIREMYVEDFPCIVICDAQGNDLYDMVLNQSL